MDLSFPNLSPSNLVQIRVPPFAGLPPIRNGYPMNRMNATKRFSYASVGARVRVRLRPKNTYKILRTLCEPSSRSECEHPCHRNTHDQSDVRREIHKIVRYIHSMCHLLRKRRRQYTVQCKVRLHWIGIFMVTTRSKHSPACVARVGKEYADALAVQQP